MFLMIPEALREALGTQMVLSKYSLSGTLPHTEKAKKTLTQEFHVTQEADIQKNKKITKQSRTKKWYCDRISSEDWILQVYFISNAGKTSS